MGKYTLLRSYHNKEALLEAAPSLAFGALTRSLGGNKEWGRLIDVEGVVAQYHQMADGEHPYLETAILNGSHLITFSLGELWFAPGKKILVEQMFIRIGPGSRSEAFEALDELARDNGVDAIIMATSLAPDDEQLGTTYVEHGYSKQSTQWVKLME